MEKYIITARKIPNIDYIDNYMFSKKGGESNLHCRKYRSFKGIKIFKKLNPSTKRASGTFFFWKII